MHPTTVTPRASLLCLYADALVPLDDGKSKGTALPGRDVKVKTAPLAAHVCAFALWALEQDGAVRLSVEEKRRLGFRVRKVIVEAVRSERRSSVIEQGLLDAALGRGPQDADDVVATWLRRDMVDPHSTVVGWALAEALPSGVLQEVDAGRGALAAVVRGRTELVPVLAREAEARAAFADVLEGWRHLEATRGELAQALVDKCLKGLNARVESVDHD